MATLYCAEHVHIARVQIRIPTPYFCIGYESMSESVPEHVSGNVLFPTAWINAWTITIFSTEEEEYIKIEPARVLRFPLTQKYHIQSHKTHQGCT